MGERAAATYIQLRLLGGFSAAVAGEPGADRWRLRKAKTLVKLLALAPGHRLHREIVADRFWPDAEPQTAANNVHQLIHAIRRMLGPESVTLTDDVVLLSPAVTVDVDLFEQAASNARRTGEIADLQAALELWTGPLLPEDEYADWAEEDRERLTETHAAVATLLGSRLLEHGEPEAALALLEPISFTRPLDEPLHRGLMDVLEGLGRRWEAIETYERLRDALDDAYAAEPQPQTKTLYRRLLTGSKPLPAKSQPDVPEPSTSFSSRGSHLTLVGRQLEWEQLRASWQRASSGESQLFLLTGVAGIGKTRLAEELLTWADEQGIPTARTRCYGAEGRLALAPVAEWLRSDAIRQSFPRLEDVWLTETARLVPELLTERPKLPRPEPMTEFGQRQRFFEALSQAVLAAPPPLLLLIDDLQWCDQETLQWLHFLLRFGQQKRLLIMGTARLEEVLATHPVAQWLFHLRSEGQLTELALDSLDTAETAQLAAQVTKRELNDQSALRLYQETEGNPLFVVEMASAGLSERARKLWRGENDSSRYQLSIANLPPRMHAVISGRLAQLSPAAHELAGLAATFGRAFTLELLHRASGGDVGTLTQGLDELWHRRILRAGTPRPILATTNVPPDELFSAGPQSFDFSHDKIRDVAYAELSPIKQRYWHLRIARALKVINATNLAPVSAQLAAHYEQAGEADRAIPFYQHAAEVSQSVYAHEEAIGLLRHGLRLMHNVPDKAVRDESQLALLRLLSLSLVATHGYGAPEALDALTEAQGLHQRLGKPPDPLLLRALAIAGLNSRNFQQGLGFGDQLLQLADQQSDSILLVEGHYVLGVTLSWAGSFTRSRIHLEQALAHYDPKHSPTHITRYSQDPSVVCQCRLAFDLWCLGYGEQAQATQYKGLTQAQALAHPFSLAYALVWDAMLQGEMGKINSLLQSSEAALVLSDEHHLRFWSAWAIALRGWALARGGDPERGIAELRRGDEQMRAVGAFFFLQPFISFLIAEQLVKIGKIQEGLEVTNEALRSATKDPYWCDAELQRLRGDLLLAAANERHAEAAYRRAIQIAQKQQAKLFELRAATSLARLWLQQHRTPEAREMLTQTYAWFTEGFDTPDVEDAQALLDASPSAPSSAQPS
jgi:DNA-binding SARP family transcriptional activator